MTSEKAVREDVPGVAGGRMVSYARWGERVVAALLDNGIVVGVVWLVFGSTSSLTLYFGMDAPTGRAVDLEWPVVSWPVAVLLSILVLQGLTGWTPGKVLLGIRVIHERTGRPAGVMRILGRQLWHFVDAVFCMVGYLRPLVHEKRRTFADSITGTVVVDQRPGLSGRPRVALYVAASVVCALGVGYGYVPIESARTTEVAAAESDACRIAGDDPRLTDGDMSLGGEVLTESDRRLWTVRTTRMAHPEAQVMWRSDAGAPGTDYRIELTARPLGKNSPEISRSWTIDRYGGVTPARVPSWDVVPGHHRGPDADARTVTLRWNEPPDTLGNHVRVDVRVLADGEELMACGGDMDYDTARPA